METPSPAAVKAATMIQEVIKDARRRTGFVDVMPGTNEIGAIIDGMEPRTATTYTKSYVSSEFALPPVAGSPSSDTPETDAMIDQYKHLLPNWLATDVFAGLARRLERERDELRAKHKMHHAEAERLSLENEELCAASYQLNAIKKAFRIISESDFNPQE